MTLDRPYRQCSATSAPRIAKVGLTKVNLLQARQAIAPLLFGSLDGQLENVLYAQATEAMIHVPPVWLPPRYDKEGRCVFVGEWRQIPDEMRTPDFKQRVQALKDLKALSEERATGKELGNQLVVIIDPRIAGTAPLEEGDLACPGYYPALGAGDASGA